MRFKAQQCPAFLKAKALIDWGGHSVFIHHHIGKGLPCMNCHRLKHSASACATLRHLRKPEEFSIVATSTGIGQLPLSHVFDSAEDRNTYLFAKLVDDEQMTPTEGQAAAAGSREEQTVVGRQ